MASWSYTQVNIHLITSLGLQFSPSNYWNCISAMFWSFFIKCRGLTRWKDYKFRTLYTDWSGLPCQSIVCCENENSIFVWIGSSWFQWNARKWKIIYRPRRLRSSVCGWKDDDGIFLENQWIMIKCQIFFSLISIVYR